jgi:exonuclease III
MLIEGAYLIKSGSQRIRASASALSDGDMNTFRDSRDSWSFANSFGRRDVGCDERAMDWFSGVFARGWNDSLETHCPSRPLYTWWANDRLYSEGRGTRVDYILALPALLQHIRPQSGAVYSETRRGGHAQIAISLDSIR